MMKTNNIGVFLILSAILVIVLSAARPLADSAQNQASEIPPMPDVVYGTVKIDGGFVPIDTPITASCTGYIAGQTVTFEYNSETVYQMDVLGDDPGTPAKDGCDLSETIDFTIGPVAALEHKTWAIGSSQLDLTAYSGGSIFLPYITR